MQYAADNEKEISEILSFTTTFKFMMTKNPALATQDVVSFNALLGEIFNRTVHLIIKNVGMVKVWQRVAIRNPSQHNRNIYAQMWDFENVSLRSQSKKWR